MKKKKEYVEPQLTPLFLRGYSVIPTPQKVELKERDIVFDDSWTYDASNIGENHIAVRTLLRDLRNFYSLELKAGSGDKKVIRLSVKSGAVKIDDSERDPEREKQAYRLEITSDFIEITGNADQGLFYGVQTFLQLLKPNQGRLTLPECVIEDWPTFYLRFIHWDTKHHQDRIETLKRYLDWAARFKINMIGFELEDKFEYPSHPIIGAPGAFTTEELQEIVNYGLERYIQVVPQIQAPAHFAYVLKHPEFADLREDGNNYEACLCNEKTYELIFSMYDDVIKATRGVEYFFVSTDEVYYAGICKRPYNPEVRSLTWVEFVRKAYDFLTSRGRKVLIWAEYPLLPKHVSLLPSDIIDGVLGNDLEMIEEENKHGIRQLAYVPIQGSEFLFPNYFPLEEEGRRPLPERLKEVFKTLSIDAWLGNPIGVYGAAWDDSGLHNETFWLGWTAVAEYGWTPGTPPIEQTVIEFMNIYYGPHVTNMVEVYRGLQRQARFFEGSWDRVVSRERGPGYGNSEGPGIGIVRYDYTLPRPPLPALPGLEFIPIYRGEGKYSRLVEKAKRMLVENNRITHLILENISKTDRNKYNLEVLLSLAKFTAHHCRMIIRMGEIEDALEAARLAARKPDPERVMEHLNRACELASLIIEERYRVFGFLKNVWEKSRYPKGREVDGKKFYHVLDDTKDHWADRRPDLTYLIAPEESIGLERWIRDLKAVMEKYREVAKEFQRRLSKRLS